MGSSYNGSVEGREESTNEKKKFISALYFANTGKRLDWENLCTYNEKMQWIKLYDNPEQKTLLTDKYKVRKYVKDKIGEKY